MLQRQHVILLSFEVTILEYVLADAGTVNTKPVLVGAVTRVAASIVVEAFSGETICAVATSAFTGAVIRAIPRVLAEPGATVTVVVALVAGLVA